MRRTYHSDRPLSDLQRDVFDAELRHGTGSREYRRAYMRWYRTTHPDLRARELDKLRAYRTEVPR